MNFPFTVQMDNEFDAVGFGTNAVDHLITVPSYPVFNSKVELTGYTQAAGGEAASTMVGLQRLGLKTAYAGRFGSDEAGKIGIGSLAAEGVDTKFAEIVEGAATQVAFIVIDERTGERTIIWHRDDKLAYGREEAPIGIAGRGRILHLTPHDAAACVEMATAAREKGVIVTLDIDNIFPAVEELLPLIDVCIASAEFTEKLFGASDHRTALQEITRKYGCAVVGVTLGAAGSLFLCAGEFLETQAFAVPGGCVDTTGAGDAFRTGFLYGMLTGETIEGCARTANAVAALKCRSVGARAALPDAETLKQMLKKD